MTWRIFKEKFNALCINLGLNKQETTALSSAMDKYIKAFEHEQEENSQAIQFMAESIISKLVKTTERSKQQSIPEKTGHDIKATRILEFANLLLSTNDNINIEYIKKLKKEFEDNISTDKADFQQAFINLISGIVGEIKFLKSRADTKVTLALHDLANQVTKSLEKLSGTVDQIEKIAELKLNLNYINSQEFFDYLEAVAQKNNVYRAPVFESIMANIVASNDSVRILDKLNLHIDSVKYLDVDSLREIGKSISGMAKDRFDHKLWDNTVDLLAEELMRTPEGEMSTDKYSFDTLHGKTNWIYSLEELANAMKLVNVTQLSDLMQKQQDLSKQYASRHFFHSIEQIRLEHLPILVPAILYLSIAYTNDTQIQDIKYYASIFNVKAADLKQMQSSLLKILDFSFFKNVDIDKNPESVLLMLSRMNIEDRSNYVSQHGKLLNKSIIDKANKMNDYVNEKISKLYKTLENNNMDKLQEMLLKYKEKEDVTVGQLDKINDQALYVEVISKIEIMIKDKDDAGSRLDR